MELSIFIIPIKIMNLNYQLIKSFLSKFGPYYASGGGIPARTRARVKRPKRGPKWECGQERCPGGVINLNINPSVQVKFTTYRTDYPKMSKKKNFPPMQSHGMMKTIQPY